MAKVGDEDEVEGCSCSSPAILSASPTPSSTLVDDLERLRRTRLRINAAFVIGDATVGRETSCDASVHLWLRERRDVARDAEEVLGVCRFEHLRARPSWMIKYQEMAAAAAAAAAWVGGPTVAPSPLHNNTDNGEDDQLWWGRIASKVEKIRGRYEEIAKHREALLLEEEEEEGGRRQLPRRNRGEAIQWVAQQLEGRSSSPSSAAASASSSALLPAALGDDLAALQRLLTRIRAVLYDAETREIYDLSVHLWLRDLRGVASDAMGLLDEAARIIQDQEPPLHPPAGDQSPKAGDEQQVGGSNTTLASPPLDMGSVPFWDRIASKIQRIKASFEEIARHRKALRFRGEDGRRLRRNIRQQDLDMLMLLSTGESSAAGRNNNLEGAGDDLVIKQLARLLARIKAFLLDAGEREIYDESVHAWVQELKGVAYDADQVLDEHEYQLLRAKFQDEGLPKLDGPRLSDMDVVVAFSSKTGEIGERFEEISRRREVLHLSAVEDRRRHHLNSGGRPLRSTTLMEEKSKVHIRGREHDLRKLIDGLLLSDECSKSSNLTVIPVVGMPGVGKTTLVEHVYNDPKIEKGFKLRGWVPVSIEFDVTRLTQRILECLTGTGCGLREFDAVQNRLMEVLKGKRLLLVLDDVWNEDRDLWDRLQAPLSCAGKGSAVVTTTRSEITAKIMQTVPFHRLGCLSNDNCRTIFQHFAFHGLELTDNKELVKIGEKIAHKCKGLPLAAKVLGRILWGNSEVEKWEAVLQSETWQLDFGYGGMLSTSMSSYLHLPPFLKQCFVYCSLFPKDYNFQRDELVLLWIAQGFIWCEGETPVEDVGAAYVDELIQRSLFQCSDAKDKSAFVMHDMIHNLTQYISKGEYCRIEGEGGMPFKPSGTRHLSIADKRLDVASVLESLPCSAAWGLRTLHLFQVNELRDLPSILLSSFKGLRTLILGGLPIAELPDSIGDLKHLRYLDLSGTHISKLPETVCNLHHLQTLLLRHCKHLEGLPRVVLKLMNLRYLKLSR